MAVQEQTDSWLATRRVARQIRAYACEAEEEEVEVIGVDHTSTGEEISDLGARLQHEAREFEAAREYMAGRVSLN